MATKKAAAKTTAAPAPAKEVKPIDGFRVVAMTVENVKKVAFAQIRPKGNVIEVTGANGSGKTTILDSISYAITGTSDIPTMPIQRGKKAAKISVNFGEFKVTRFFTAVDPATNAKGHHYITRIEIEGRDRQVYREPQKLLDSFKSQISFDPLAFTRMPTKEQFETLRGLVKLDVDLDAIEAERVVAYNARRDAGRDVDNLTAKLKMMSEPPADLPAEPINTQALTEKLQNAANHNSMVEAARQRRLRLVELIEASFKEAEKMRADAYAILKEAELIDGLSITVQHDATKNQNCNVSKLQAEMDGITVGELIDTAAVALELQNAQGVNAAIARAVQYRTTLDELKAANLVWAGHDKTEKAKKQERADAIARAKMPFEELSIGDGEVMYKGLPFDQASAAEQISVSMALGMAANPKLRVLLIRDGSLLDAKTMAMIVDMATENGYQVWIERVDTSGKVGVVMEDGEASGDEVEKPQ